MAQIFTDWISRYGSLAFFPLLYANALGIPVIPAESLLFAGSVLAERGKLSLEVMLAAAFAGAVLGNQTGWCIGICGKQRLVQRIVALLHINAEKFAKFESVVQKKGAYFVVVARFIPIARELNGLLSGSLRIGFAPFLTANIAGAALWVLCWGALPYFFARLL